jgi:hypothetical protein
MSVDFGNDKTYPGVGTIAKTQVYDRNFDFANTNFVAVNSAGGYVDFTRTSVAPKTGGGMRTIPLTGTPMSYDTFLYNNHTWEVWVKINNINPTNIDITEGYSVIACYPGWHAGFMYTANTLEYQIITTGPAGTVCASWTLGLTGAQLNQGQWYQIAVTRSGTIFTPYVNGVQLGTSYNRTLSNPGVNTNVLWVAQAVTNQSPNPPGASSYCYYADLSFATMRMYNAALTASDILQNFNAERMRFNL